MSLAARQVRRPHLILVIRATGAPQNRSSADSRACDSGQPLPSPWIALLRVPVTAPGQTVRVCRVGSPTCLCNAAHNATMHALSELAVVHAGRNLARGAWYSSRRSVSGFGEGLAGAMAGFGGGLVATAVDGPGDHVGDASVRLDDQGVEEAA